ncbi:uncharacterized protein LOC117649072 isoform X1 [Thrips palmi]|uniref:Uncharacterized protein LOC117649072 isoform X1 n=1 Tax=Thrips palmi TaxID=161013 RepID=A0A6P8ZA06_THRPL|nr:uncharacterized protein LOC117649072 isoform X1 [Thrips palmi]
MEIDVSLLLYDEYNCPVFVMNDYHAKNFMALFMALQPIAFQRNWGAIKLRFSDELVRDVNVWSRRLLDHLQDNVKTIKAPFEVQAFVKSGDKSAYDFRRLRTTRKLRESDIKPLADYLDGAATSENCCERVLREDGLNRYFMHYWDHIENIASDNNPARITEVKQPLYYAAGFSPPPGSDLNAAGINFDDFGCLLNNLEEKIKGISDPLLYIGKALSTAALHDEDASLASLNLLISGSNKAWIVYSGAFVFDLLEYLKTVPLNLADKSCSNALHHKTFITNPDCMPPSFHVPYQKILQRPGEFVLTFYCSAHQVSNLGDNLAVARNLADENWVPFGLYSQVSEGCTCIPAIQNVKIDARKIAARASVFVDGEPPRHPYFRFRSRHCQVDAHPTAEVHSEDEVAAGNATPSEPAICLGGTRDDALQDTSTKRAAGGAGSRRHTPPSLPCIAEGCGRVLSGGMDKLRRHIKLVHKKDETEMQALLDHVAEVFGMRQGNKDKQICPECGCQVYGKESVLRKHLKWRCRKRKM